MITYYDIHIHIYIYNIDMYIIKCTVGSTKTKQNKIEKTSYVYLTYVRIGIIHLAEKTK
jgi:hypothetical protein